MQKRLQVTLAPAARHLVDLGVHGRPVLAAIDGPVHAHRRRPIGALCEAGQCEGRGRIGPGLVVHEQSVDADVGDLDDPDVRKVTQWFEDTGKTAWKD